MQDFSGEAVTRQLFAVYAHFKAFPFHIRRNLYRKSGCPIHADIDPAFSGIGIQTASCRSRSNAVKLYPIRLQMPVAGCAIRNVRRV
jgi:hypothetical protein